MQISMPFIGDTTTELIIMLNKAASSLELAFLFVKFLSYLSID